MNWKESEVVAMWIDEDRIYRIESIEEAALDGRRE